MRICLGFADGVTNLAAMLMKLHSQIAESTLETVHLLLGVVGTN